MNEFLWGTYPYICIVLFFAVPLLRMLTRPYSWSTRASGLFGRRLLGIASTLMHWGLIFLLVGHLLGLFGGVLGIGAAIFAFYWIGLIGGVLVLIGSCLALYRRFTNEQVRAMSQPDDYIVHFFLIPIVLLALFQVVVHRIFGVAYPASTWAASLWTLTPQPELMASASLISKLHVFLALTFFGYFPFTKLVHFWTFPVNYFVRPHQSMRTAKYRFQRKWEMGLLSDKSWLTYGLGAVALMFLISGFLMSSGNAAAVAATGSAGGKLMGDSLYVSQCARCHGISGKGNGLGYKSGTFSTQPRDLVEAQYHFVSTINAIASDADLTRTIRFGLAGSGMPAYPDLTDEQIDSLVGVLNEFRIDKPAPGAGFVVPPMPASTPASVTAGRELFVTYCVTCHGTEGRGDGETSAYDWRELVISARDLTAGEFKVGGSPEELFTRISLGVPGGFGGEIMTSFSLTLSEEQRWSIVHFLQEKVIPKNEN